MDGLFLNYRREDSAPYAGRLYDFLKRSFPGRPVFMDIDAIDPGDDFVEAIDKTLVSSRVVIAVIGPSWTKVTDGVGKRRLDNPDDYVVRELSAALKSSARIVPVLVGGASMPRSEQLPATLQSLTRRHAIEISDTRFTSDSERLAESISRAFSGGSSQRDFGLLLSRFGFGVDLKSVFPLAVWMALLFGALDYISQSFGAQAGGQNFLIGTLWLVALIASTFLVLKRKPWARVVYAATVLLFMGDVYSVADGLEIHWLLASHLLFGLLAIALMFFGPTARTFGRK